MRGHQVRVTATASWEQWSAELESAVVNFVQGFAKSWGHRARFASEESSASTKGPERWKLVAFISAGSSREAEHMRREAIRRSRAIGLNLWIVN